MRLDEVFKQLKFDSRMVDWNKSQGFLTEEEYKKHLNSLEDLATNADKLGSKENGSQGTGHVNGSRTQY